MAVFKELIGILIALALMLGLCKISPIPKAGRPKEDVIVWEPTEPEPETTQIETEPETEWTPAIEDLQTVEIISDAEKDLLVRTAYLEAGNQGAEGMALVMNVILNRANLCNASITEIIYSPGQFTVVDLLYTKEPTAEAYQALDMVMNGWDASQGALYFCSPAHNSWHRRALTYLFTYGGHEFYK